MNYRIAFFTADWNYELVESTLHGLKQYVDDHENVQLCVFDCFGKDTETDNSRSEYAIYKLADLSKFDGVLIQGNQVVLSSAREELGRRVREAGIPAVSVDCPIEGCALIGVDNRKAQEEITDHVIKAHGARRLVYLTGILDNGCQEAQDRLAGFQDACEKNNIPQENITVIPCTWRTSDGNRIAEEWARSGRPLPDAFICANDDMALGMLETLEKNGFRIPKEVIVTGFDNLTSAELSSPRLSTVKRDNEALNYEAMEMLIGMIDGTEKRDQVTFEHGIVCSESCGCRDKTMPDYVRNKYFHQTRFLKNFYILQDQMAHEMFEAADLPELMRIVERNETIFGCNGVYLCVNDYYFDNYEKKNWQHDSESFGAEMILATRGSSGYQLDENNQYARFPTSALLPGDFMRRERFWVFYPLHYNTYSIGYLAMHGISEAAKLNLHESIFSFLEIAIENVRKKCLLRNLNEVLDDLYVRDPLTGLFNRFGLKRYGEKQFNLFRQEEHGVQVLFIDLDDMKDINDQYSHESGDEALCAAARILQSASGPRDFIMRYGGDEFLVIASGAKPELRQEIMEDVDAFNETVAYRLRMSIGMATVKPGKEMSLEECIQVADSQMYEIKNWRKAAEGKHPR